MASSSILNDPEEEPADCVDVVIKQENTEETNKDELRSNINIEGCIEVIIKEESSVLTTENLKPDVCDEESKSETLNPIDAGSQDDTDKRRRHECIECRKSFKTEEMYTSHSCLRNAEEYCEKSQSPSGLRPNECTQCGKVFSTFTNLNRHLQTHSGLKPFECAVCAKTFTHKSYRNAHILRLHNNAKPEKFGEKSFKCSECEKSFFAKADLIRHSHVHTGIKPFECGQCERTFTQKSHRNLHVLRVHSSEEDKELLRMTRVRSYKCSQCEKSFMRQVHLNRHSRVHSGIKPFECAECSKTFTQKSHRDLHLLRVHNSEKPGTNKESSASGGHNQTNALNAMSHFLSRLT